ncbi:MAG: hypothetical protein FWG44_03280 [Oscillospiraceae bacterium]|nr:hypothetical protein [Oscillospiraceae bacterium]
MQKKSFLRVFLETLGYVLAGNLLALVVTISLGAFNGNIALGISAFCSITLFFACVFSAAHKDGEYERKLQRRKVLEEPDPNRWIMVGVIIWVLICIPCVLLIFNPQAGFLLAFRLSVASMMAFSLFFGSSSIPFWTPLVFIGIFALIPVACRLGYYVGYYEKAMLENIIYKKQKK